MSDESERTAIRRPNRLPAAEPPDEIVHLLRPQAPATAEPIRLGQGGLVIGRVEECGLVLDGTDVSRRHCRIDLVDGEALACDLGSTNGTFVNGSRIAGQTKLAPGARLGVGSHQFRYERHAARQHEEMQALHHELQQANQYVMAILPAPLREGPVRAEWLFQPCTSLGGDVFGYRDLGGGLHAGYMLDVAGHGVAAAMHAISVANLLRQDGMQGVDPRDPAAVMARLNLGFPMEAHDGAFFTAWYWVYAAVTREMRFCSAGHHPAYLLAPGHAPFALQAPNPAIGFLPDIAYRAARVIIPPGAAIYLFSDGAFEIEGPDGHRWALDDFVALLGDPTMPGLSEPQRLYRRVREAARPGPPDDDCSIVFLSFP